VTARRLTVLANARLSDVRQRDGHDHPDQVLDDDEPHGGVAHGRADVAPGRQRERAEEDVNDEPDQQLDVEAHAEPLGGAVVSRSPRAPLRDAGNGARQHQQADEQHHPAQIGMDCQERCVHITSRLALRAGASRYLAAGPPAAEVTSRMRAAMKSASNSFPR
jgi:hypothetical protein